MRRFIKFILGARLSNPRRKAGMRLSITALLMTLSGPVYSQIDTRAATRGHQNAGTVPGQIPTPRARKGFIPLPVGFRLAGEGKVEWIGKEFIEPLRRPPPNAYAHLSLGVGARGYLGNEWKIDQIIDDRNALLARGWEDEPAIKISGYDFSMMADGETLSDNPFFHVTGTEPYKNVAGQATSIFVVEPLHETSPPTKPMSSASRRHLPYRRSWTNATNGRSIIATYYGYDGNKGTVQLVNRDNEVVEILLENLSTEDKSLVRKLTKIRREVVKRNRLMDYWSNIDKEKYPVYGLR